MSSIKTDSTEESAKEINKYTFDFTFCDNVFDILLQNNFIRIIDHKALPSPQKLEELTYCKWHNSFNHNTSNCNMFSRVVQSAIDKGQLKFSKAQKMDQLDSIGLHGKQVSNSRFTQRSTQMPKREMWSPQVKTRSLSLDCKLEIF